MILNLFCFTSFANLMKKATILWDIFQKKRNFQDQLNKSLQMITNTTTICLVFLYFLFIKEKAMENLLLVFLTNSLK